MTYVLLGTRGPSWADAAINAVLIACVVVHLSSYLNGIARRNLIVSLASIVLTVAFFLAFAFNLFSCWHGSHRYSNCGTEHYLILAFVNAFVLLACNLDLVRQIALASAVSIPLLLIGGHIYLSAPLYWELLTHDLTKHCYVQSKSAFSFYYRPHQAQRILHTWDVKTGPIVGEHSPRVYRVTANKAQVWKYTRRQFSLGSVTTDTLACAQGAR